jgi:hypothetical protein
MKVKMSTILICKQKAALTGATGGAAAGLGVGGSGRTKSTRLKLQDSKL